MIKAISNRQKEIIFSESEIQNQGIDQKAINFHLNVEFPKV